VADWVDAPGIDTKLYNHFIDPTLDMLTVRLHGRVPGATGGAKSQVLVETVSNMEVIYDDASELAQFMTHTKKMAHIDAVFNATNGKFATV
jgi:hypothetical protein